MELTTGTERTTAITDLMVTILCLIFSYLLYAVNQEPTFWFWAFLIMSINRFLGAIVHGIELDEMYHNDMSVISSIFIAAFFTLVLIAAINDIWGAQAVTDNIYRIIIFDILFLGTTRLKYFRDSFVPRIIFTLVISIFCIAAYLAYASQYNHYAPILISLGFLAAIIGGVVRSMKSIKLNIKSFQLDNNGVYHLLLIISFILMFKGVMNLNEFKILITAF
ncbi:MAG: hypothetical protein GY754_45655 [bacterium]|nr:hypothetical protein [bacterium]